jgi:DNA-binding Lrp family transcriptional regulator
VDGGRSLLIKGFVFVAAKTGMEKDLADALFKIPEILETHMIVGDYDVLAVLGVEDDVPTRFPAEKMISILTEKIRTMDYVKDTSTIMSVQSQVKRNRITDVDAWAKGFVFVKVRTGRERSAMQDLYKVADVSEVHMVAGNYDLLAVLEVRKTLLPPRYPQIIADIVVDKIRKINGVEDTQTFIPDSSQIRSIKK